MPSGKRCANWLPAKGIEIAKSQNAPKPPNDAEQSNTVQQPAPDAVDLDDNRRQRLPKQHHAGQHQARSNGVSGRMKNRWHAPRQPSAKRPPHHPAVLNEEQQGQSAIPQQKLRIGKCKTEERNRPKNDKPPEQQQGSTAQQSRRSNNQAGKRTIHEKPLTLSWQASLMDEAIMPNPPRKTGVASTARNSPAQSSPAPRPAGRSRRRKPRRNRCHRPRRPRQWPAQNYCWPP